MMVVDPVCCSPIVDEVVSRSDAIELATRFKALGDPARVRLLSLIATAGEMCACDLVAPVGLSQPTVSHHLKVLREAGLVITERRGRWIHYRPDPAGLVALRDTLGIRTTA